MNKSMLEMKKAVRAGYWNLLRYNPGWKRKRNPLSVDSSAPTESYRTSSWAKFVQLLKLGFPEE